MFKLGDHKYINTAEVINLESLFPGVNLGESFFFLLHPKC